MPELTWKRGEKFNNLVKEGAADEMVIARLITRATDITFHDTPHTTLTTTTGQTGLWKTNICLDPLAQVFYTHSNHEMVVINKDTVYLIWHTVSLRAQSFPEALAKFWRLVAYKL